MKKLWIQKDLSDHWSLNYEELELIKLKTEQSHLPFCAQLKHYQNFGFFPSSYHDIPNESLQYLMSQLGAQKPDNYKWNGRIARRHKVEILEFLGIKKSNKNERESFKTRLINEFIPKTNNINKLLTYAEVWFFEHKLVAPSKAVLERLIRSAISIHEEKLFKSIASSISSKDKSKLNDFLSPENKNVNFSKIKTDPGKIGLDSVVKESEKLSFINSLSMPEFLFKKINKKILSGYKNACG